MKTPRPPSDELIQLLSEYDLKVGELALALRSIVLDEAPAAIETVLKTYVVALAYSFTGRWTDGFCHIVVYRRHVNLGFNHGAELEDPEKLLVGSGKLFRHIKIEQPEDLEKPYLRSFIRAAIKHSKADRATRPAKRPPRSAVKASAKRRRAK